MGWKEILKSYDLDEFIIKTKKPKKGKKEKGEKETKVKIIPFLLRHSSKMD